MTTEPKSRAAARNIVWQLGAPSIHSNARAAGHYIHRKEAGEKGGTQAEEQASKQGGEESTGEADSKARPGGRAGNGYPRGTQGDAESSGGCNGYQSPQGDAMEEAWGGLYVHFQCPQPSRL